MKNKYSYKIYTRLRVFILLLSFFLTTFSITGFNDSSLLYSSYFGGTGNDHGLCVTQDSQGNIIVAGITYSSDFPTTDGAYDTTFNGESDIFISKWSSDGETLLFSTFLGGSDNDTYIESTGVAYYSLEIIVDSNDDILIYGTTSSTDFPTTTGALNETNNGNCDVFLTKLAKNGSTLIFSTFLGGSERDFFNLGNNRLVLDDNDVIYITGQTESVDFPLSSNALNDSIRVREVFLCKISPDGSSVLYSTLLGGSEKEFGMVLALDNDNNMIIGGVTYSNDYPVTASAFDTTYSNNDIFISKISADGSTLMFSTYIGDSGWEQVTGMTVDENNDIYFIGATSSSNFPTTTSSLDPSINGLFDIFVSKLSADGSTMLTSTFIGGTNSEFPSCLVLSATNQLYVLGYTMSTVSTTPNAFDNDLNGLSDYLIVKLNPSLTNLTYASYLGGTATDDHGVSGGANGHDAGEFLLLDTNSCLIVGSTRSDDFPVTSDAYSSTFSGNSDVFITKLTDINVELTTDETTIGETSTTTKEEGDTTPTSNMSAAAGFTTFLFLVGLVVIISIRRILRRE